MKSCSRSSSRKSRFRFTKKALEQSQGQLVYFLRLGVANVRAQRYERAREVFTTSLQRYPDNANLYFLLGYAARAEGQYDQAVAAFRQALKLQPDNPGRACESRLHCESTWTERRSRTPVKARDRARSKRVSLVSRSRAVVGEVEEI